MLFLHFLNGSLNDQFPTVLLTWPVLVDIKVLFFDYLGYCWPGASCKTLNCPIGLWLLRSLQIKPSKQYLLNLILPVVEEWHGCHSKYKSFRYSFKSCFCFKLVNILGLNVSQKDIKFLNFHEKQLFFVQSNCVKVTPICD